MGVESLVIPGGQEAFRIRARRVTSGLLLDVKVHPIFEQLIDTWCDSSYKRPLYDWGQTWRSTDHTDPILVKEINQPLNYNLNAIGEAFISPGALHNNANLSFLRFAGISKGVQFVVEGVFSLDEVKRILTSIKLAVENLYQRELASFDIELVVSTREK